MRTLSFALFVLLSAGRLSPAAPPDFPSPDQLPARPELPDPFVMLDGTPVKTPADWQNRRRPELKLLFQHYMYGYLPAPPRLTMEVTKTAEGVLGGAAVLKEVLISFPDLEAKSQAPRIRLALIVPARAERPVPVFLGLNKCGNQTVIADEAVSIFPETWRHPGCGDDPEALRGKDVDFWCVDYLIERGYGFATFHESDIDPDRHDFTDGIHAAYGDGAPGDAGARWGTISAWAWGLHRCVDYLTTDPAVDSKRICLIGHSRRGKTALWAAAMDERVALVIPHQSGTGGMALSRNNNQETVERINRSFPHWFNDNFTAFNNNEEKLPIDQHLLVALIAPRPLLETSGLQDTWANYESSAQGIQAADAVYKFLGAPGIRGAAIANEQDDLSSDRFGNLLQYRRDTKHTLNRGYWEGILDFADRQWKN